MKNNEDKALVLPGGNGIANYMTNSIENRVPIKLIDDIRKNAAFKERLDEDLQDQFSEIAKNQSSYSVWGYSRDNSTLRNEKLKEGMPIFITYRNAAIYKAEVYKVIEDPDNILDIWAGRSWEYKILLKNVIKIFIPDPNNTYESKKKLKGLIENNEFGRNLGQIKHIQSLYEGKKKVDNYSKYGFSQIIGRKTKGNIQGAIFSEFSSDKVEEEFERYVIKSHAECILEVYDGIDSDSQE
mgnify:CR=1 FL=1